MKLYFLDIKLLLNIIFIGISLASYSQIFSPEIENYSIEDYQADNQNWGIDVDKNGVVFIANNKGLLRFNGHLWQLLELPSKTIIRSVLCVENKIYIGSYEEFGFWKADIYGNYHYTSLTSLYNGNSEFQSEEFWQIIEFNGKVVFRSFGGIYIYDGSTISKVNDSGTVSYIGVYQNKLITASLENTFREVKGNKHIPFDFNNNDKNFNTVSTIAIRDSLLFFFDLNKGGYIYDSKKLNPLPKRINIFLHNYVVNKAIIIDDRTIVFGTIKNGIYIYDLKTEDIQCINKELGLNNNTILGLKYHNGTIWGGLDNGVSTINLKSPYQFYQDITGVLGAVYDVEYFENKLYLASNTGVYSFTENNKLHLIKNSEGHVWDLSIINNKLYCGHNNGMYSIENNQLIPIDIASGGVYGYFKTPSHKPMYLQGNYTGINLLKFEKEKLEIFNIENLSFPINKIIFESEHVIWATHPYKGVYRIKLNEGYTKALEFSNYGNTPNFKQFKSNVFKVGKEIVFYNSNKWFKYFKEEDSIGVYKKFKDLTSNSIIGIEDGGMWFLNNGYKKSLQFFNEGLVEKNKISVSNLKQYLVPNYEKIYFKNDSIRIVTLNDGFATFNLKEPKVKNKETFLAPVIDKIYSRDKYFLKNDSIFKIHYLDAKYLTFEVFSPNQSVKGQSYILSGRVNQKEEIKNGKFTLQNLPYGDYSLSIQNEGFLSARKISLTVLPPWYLSNIMKLLYLVLMISAVYIYHRFNETKSRKQQLEAKRIFIRENQKKIQEIERQNLEKDILNKKRELANSTETIIKKNETIILLRNELNRLLNVSPNKSRTKKLIDLSKNKKDADKDWKAFETNFNELHADFFKRLITEYPKLTTKDLKLCAYIKSGLISKEIAPLMGITIRGVEIHRYRLRKKLNIESNENISNFLMLF
ncbi:triple tyrosine motif-containing protein [Algibacter agarivorans]|uniref:Triple tyrosine motif-containing protein n=1 Tax=Algibacter agarivorans TaxID=1109741 RepID=A0ABP9GWH7_9FLAO